MTNTANLCEILGGVRNVSPNTMKSHWKTTPTLSIRLHLRHHNGNQAAPCGQRGTGIRGNLHLRMNSDFLKKVPDERFLISFAGNLISWQSTGCKQYTYRAHVFLMRILSTCLSQPVVTVVQVHAATLSRSEPTHRVARNHKAHCMCLAPKQSHFIAQCHVLNLA